MLKFNIQNTFTKELPADPIQENTRRQVTEACFSYVTPKKTSNPKIIHVSDEMVQTLGLSETAVTSEEFKNIFTGNDVYKNTQPYMLN